MNAPVASLRHQAGREMASLSGEEIDRLQRYYESEMDQTRHTLGEIDYYTDEYGNQESAAVAQVDNIQRRYARTLTEEQVLLEAVAERRRTSAIYRVASFVVGRMVCPSSEMALRRDSILSESYMASAKRAAKATTEVIDLAKRGEMSYERSQQELDWQQLLLDTATNGLARVAHRHKRRLSM